MTPHTLPHGAGTELSSITTSKEKDMDETKTWGREQDYKEARKALIDRVRDCCDSYIWGSGLLRYLENDPHRRFYTMTLNGSRKISYSRTGVHPYDSVRRVALRVGRWLNMAGLEAVEAGNIDPMEWRNCTDKTRMQFASDFLAGMQSEDDFTIVDGEDLRLAYRREYGGHTCMSGVHEQVWLDIYVDNPDAVKMLKYDDGGIQARALLWYLADGTKLLDRIYPNAGLHIRAIQQWAENNGFLIRTHNSLPDDGYVSFFSSHKEYPSFCAHYDVELKHKSSCLPFLDSFHWVKRRTKSTITLTNHAGFEWNNPRRALGGCYGKDYRTTCDDCGQRLTPDEQDAITDERMVYCKQCEPYDLVFCEDVGAKRRRRSATSVHQCGSVEWISNPLLVARCSACSAPELISHGPVCRNCTALRRDEESVSQVAAHPF